MSDTRSSKALSLSVRAAPVPAGGFSAWFLGQNSFILKGPDGFVLAIDPYLSDWCATRGKSKERTPRSRLFPPPIEPADLDVDLVVLTHSHCDHADPETLGVLAKKKGLRVVGPRDALAVARDAGFPDASMTLMVPGQEARFNLPGGAGVSLRSTYALPTDGSDLNHLGFLVSFPNGSTFWDTGDTAWYEGLGELATSAIKAALPAGASGPDVMAVCINAGYNNLSQWEAARLAGAAKPRYAVPVHWDLFPHNCCDPVPFRTSLEKNAPGAIYYVMEKAVRHDFSGGEFRAAD